VVHSSGASIAAFLPETLEQLALRLALEKRLSADFLPQSVTMATAVLQALEILDLAEGRDMLAAPATQQSLDSGAAFCASLLAKAPAPPANLPAADPDAPPKFMMPADPLQALKLEDIAPHAMTLYMLGLAARPLPSAPTQREIDELVAGAGDEVNALAALGIAAPLPRAPTKAERYEAAQRAEAKAGRERGEGIPSSVRTPEQLLAWLEGPGGAAARGGGGAAGGGTGGQAARAARKRRSAPLEGAQFARCQHVVHVDRAGGDVALEVEAGDWIRLVASADPVLRHWSVDGIEGSGDGDSVLEQRSAVEWTAEESLQATEPAQEEDGGRPAPSTSPWNAEGTTIPSLQRVVFTANRAGRALITLGCWAPWQRADDREKAPVQARISLTVSAAPLARQTLPMPQMPGSPARSLVAVSAQD